jgi:hypothetical protein
MKTPAGKTAGFKPRFNLYVDPSWTAVSQDTRAYEPRAD